MSQTLTIAAAIIEPCLIRPLLLHRRVLGTCQAADHSGRMRLRSADGSEQVVQAAHLMGAAGFAVVDGAPLPEMVPFGLLDGFPEPPGLRHRPAFVPQIALGGLGVFRATSHTDIVRAPRLHANRYSRALSLGESPCPTTEYPYPQAGSLAVTSSQLCERCM